MAHYTLVINTDDNYDGKELAKIVQEMLKDNCNIENTTTLVQKDNF